MAAAISQAHPDAQVDLVKGDGGDFIVTVDPGSGPREVWNKNASGLGFPEPEQVLDQISEDSG